MACRKFFHNNSQKFALVDWPNVENNLVEMSLLSKCVVFVCVLCALIELCINYLRVI